MTKRTYAGRGGGSVARTTQMKADVIGMSDEAKREKAFVENVRENQKRIKTGKKPRTISRVNAERLLQAARTPESRARHFEEYAARMRDAAKKVDASGTGNKAAAARYRLVAKGYIKRAAAARKQKK